MSVNKWIGIGNLTRDPEIKYTPSGDAVCTFSVACNEKYTDKQGQKQEKVEFINIVVWRQLAEICGKFLHKGKQVYIEGKIQSRKYETTTGETRYITEIIANTMQMLGHKDDSAPREQRPAPPGPQGSHSNYDDDPPFEPDQEIPF